MRRRIGILGIIIASALVSTGADWPALGGGPSRNASSSKGLSSAWEGDRRPAALWTAITGTQTYSSPVVARGRVLVGTQNGAPRDPAVKGDKGVLMCFAAADGRFLWQAVHDKLESGRAEDYPECGIASTPWVEGDRVYYVSNRGELVCADLEGFLDGENDGPIVDEKLSGPGRADFVWTFDCIRELGVRPHNASSSSPLVSGGVVYLPTPNGVNEDHEPGSVPDAPSFVAVDARSGKLLWSSRAGARTILHGQWSSASLLEAEDRRFIVAGLGDGVLRGFETSGTVAWEWDLNVSGSVWSPDGSGGRAQIVATPVAADGRVYAALGDDPECGAGPGRLVALEPPREAGGRPRLLWESKGEDFHRTLSSVVVSDGLVFAADLAGYLFCFDARSGEKLWTEDLLASVWASPVCIGGKVFLGDEDGDLAVYRAARTSEKLAELNLGAAIYGACASADGVLFVAARNRLHAFGRQGGSLAPSEPFGTPPVPSAGAPVPPSPPPLPPPAAQAPLLSQVDSWTSFRGGPLQDGFRPGSVRDAPRLLWTHDAASAIESTAAVADGIVVVATADAGILALALDPGGREGKVLWRVPLESGVRASPLIVAGRVFLGDDSGVFHALELARGARAWDFDTKSGAEITSSATLAGDLVLFGSYDGHLYAVEAATGKLRWEFETEGPVHGSPTVVGDRAFVAGCDGRLRVVQVASGKETGSLELEGQSGASAAVLGDRLFVGNLGTSFECIDGKTLTGVWRYRNSARRGAFYSSPAIGEAGGEAIVVVGGRNQFVHALAASDGKELWTFPTKDSVDASPVVIGNRVFAAGLDGVLYLLDLATGREVWRFAAGGGFQASPAVASGRLVISTDQGLIHCFEWTP